MITTTLLDAVNLSGPYQPGHLVYVIRDGDVIFYVGISYEPWDRLQQHLLQCDSTAELIKDNLPDSRQWQFDTYTLEDCVPFVQKYDLELSVWYTDNLHEKLALRALMEQAEQALIRLLKPLMNERGARGYDHTLPAKYDKHPIANAGVRL